MGAHKKKSAPRKLSLYWEGEGVYYARTCAGGIVEITKAGDWAHGGERQEYAPVVRARTRKAQTP